MRKRHSLQWIVLGKLDSYMPKNHGLLSYTTFKNKHKVEKRFLFKTRNKKCASRKHSQCHLWHYSSQYSFRYVSDQKKRSKNKQIGLSKCFSQWGELSFKKMAVYWVGEEMQMRVWYLKNSYNSTTNTKSDLKRED